MKRVRILLKPIIGCLILICVAGGAAYGSPITITFATSPLAGMNVSLAFDLIDGDATVNNTILLNNFRFGGGAPSGSPFLTGSAAGTLLGNVTLADTSFFNEFFQDFAPGTLLSFDLDFTTNFAGGTPDSIAFLIIDNSTGFPIPTLDPLGADTFLAVDLDGVSPVIRTFSSDPARAGLTISAPALTASIPESSSIYLVGVGLVIMALMKADNRTASTRTKREQTI